MLPPTAARWTVRLAAIAALTIVTRPAAPEARRAAPEFPTNEDLRHTRVLADPQVSPDGRFVLANVTDATVDGATRHLWLVDVEANASRQLTRSPDGHGSESQGRWSPDGRFVYFVAHRGKTSSLFRLPMDGGEAERLDLKVTPPVDASITPDAVDGSVVGDARPLPLGVSTFAIAPDGATAAVIGRDPETPGEQKQQDDKADARLVDHDAHGSRAYLLNLRTGALAPVAVPPNVDAVAWSPASDRLIVVTSAMNGTGDLGPANAAWLVSTTSPGGASRMAALPATVESVLWSGDARQIFFAAQSEADAPPGHPDLFAMTLAGGRVRNLSADYDGLVSRPALADGDADAIVAVTHHTSGGFARVSTGAFAPIDLGRGVVSDLATNARRTAWVYARMSPDQPSALYLRRTIAGPETRLNLPATAGDWRAAGATVVHWTSDRFTIEGLLYLPPEAATRKVPLIVDVHGGPSGAWLESYAPFVQFLVGHGWAVLLPNPRGSEAYGAAFVAANRNDLGGGDYRDIMAGVDAMIATQPIDGSKLGLIGYSCGGEMAGFVEGKTDRFKAIVSGAPVIDQFSEYGTEDESWYDRWYFGQPWERFADAWRQSPLAGASHAKTPFLLLQGEADATDPAGQSWEMYRALRQAGAPVQMVLYPRDDHGPLGRAIAGAPTDEPWHGFDARQRIVAFFTDAFAR